MSDVPTVRWTAETEGVDGLGFDDDHAYVVSPEELTAFDLDDGAVVWTTEIGKTNNWCGVTVEGPVLTVTCSQSRSESYDRTTGAPVGAIETPTPTQARLWRSAGHVGANELEAMDAAGVTIDGTGHAKVVRSHLFVADDEHGVRVFDVVSRELVLTVEPPESALYDTSRIVASERFVLAGLNDGTLACIDVPPHRGR